MQRLKQSIFMMKTQNIPLNKVFLFKEQILSCLDSNPANLLSTLPGNFIYTDNEWLLDPSKKRQNGLYILGTNPGTPQITESATESISQVLDQFCANNWKGTALERQVVNTSHNRYSNNLRTLIDGSGFLMPNVLLTNLIFARSKDVPALTKQFEPWKFNTIAAAFWPVHELLITQYFKPSAIIAFGNGGRSAYSFLADHLNPSGVFQHEAYGKGRCQLKWFKTKIGDLEIPVFGVPHPSRFAACEISAKRIGQMIQTFSPQYVLQV